MAKTTKAAGTGKHAGERPVITPKIADELRKAIARAEWAGVKRYHLAKAAGITPIMLCRIADATRGMKLETAERIADALGLQLTLLTKRLKYKPSK